MFPPGRVPTKHLAGREKRPKDLKLVAIERDAIHGLLPTTSRHRLRLPLRTRVLLEARKFMRRRRCHCPFSTQERTKERRRLL